MWSSIDINVILISHAHTCLLIFLYLFLHLETSQAHVFIHTNLALTIIYMDSALFYPFHINLPFIFTKQAIMKGISNALGALSAFLLLCFLLLTPASSISPGTKFLREGIQPRRLMQPLVSNSVSVKKLHSPAMQSDKASGASMRKVPPSRSNPTQNK